MAPLDQHCVFVIAGQTNASGNGNLGHLSELASDPATQAEFGKYQVDGVWGSRNDVFVSFPNELGEDFITLLEGFLSVEKFGGDAAKFGPEVGLGYELGDAFCDTIGIAKAAGVGSLAEDFRPPSSGLVGPLYTEMIENVKAFLDRMKDEIGEQDIVSGIEPKVCGFVWWHGYGDVFVPEFLGEYEDNLANLISDVRTEFGDPDLPILIAEIGGNGPDTNKQQELDLRAIQERVADNDGPNTLFTRTAPFVTGFEMYTDNDLDGDWHYFGRADVMVRIGQAFANDLKSLLPPSDVLETCNTARPSTMPSMMPSTSSKPSVSKFPSLSPTVSMQPSLSVAPSGSPSVSAAPSSLPSAKPSISNAPSTAPSISSMPSVSAAPSISSAPSTAAPTSAPTPAPQEIAPTPAPQEILVLATDPPVAPVEDDTGMKTGGLVAIILVVLLIVLGGLTYLYKRRQSAPEAITNKTKDIEANNENVVDEHESEIEESDDEDESDDDESTDGDYEVDEDESDDDDESDEDDDDESTDGDYEEDEDESDDDDDDESDDDDDEDSEEFDDEH